MNYQDKEVYFYLLLIISIILTRIPLIGKYFRVVNTLFHESGHGIMAMITSGKILKIELFSDTSGSASTLSKNKFGQFLIALAGYPVSSIFAFVFFYLIYTGNYFFILYILAGITLINLIFFVRNAYGIFWLISFAAILFVIFYYGDDFIRFGTCVFFSSIILSDSLISSFLLIVISYRDSKKAGDATNLKNITHIPSIFWAVLFFLQAVIFAYLTISQYFPLINQLSGK